MTFTRTPDFDLQRYARRPSRASQESPAGAVLRFDDETACDAAAFVFHPHQYPEEENADGSLRVRFTVGGFDVMCWHLCTWGETRSTRRPALEVRAARPPYGASSRDRGRCLQIKAHHA